MKRCSTYVIKKLPIKTTHEIPIHTYQWPKCKTLTASKAGKDVEQQFSFLTAANSNLWKTVTVFKTHTHTNSIYSLTTQSSNHTPWYSPMGAENPHAHKNMHTDVDSNFIYTAKT